MTREERHVYYAKADVEIYKIEDARPEEWHLEMCHPEADGEVHVNLFSGENAKERAIFFALEYYGKYLEVNMLI